MTTFNARSHEVHAMLDSEEFCIVRPLKPQPNPFTPSPPYAPGQSVVVREAHAIDAIRVLYAATDDINDLRSIRSGAVMRYSQSRLTLTVTDVQIKRVQDVTPEEALLAGVLIPDYSSSGKLLADAWINLWNKHHPKTPWDSNPWCVVARCKVHRCNISEMKGEAA